MVTSTLTNNTALEGSTLCQHCGLCCNGAIFSHVLVDKKEEKQAKKSGLVLRKKSDKKMFTLPCSCFIDNKCSIYKDRPMRCSGYRCNLLKAVVNGETPFEEAKDLVTSTKQETQWLLENRTAKSKNPNQKENLTKYLKSYRNLASKINDTTALSPKDKRYILRAFDYLKVIDRAFHPTSTLGLYASLIQGFNTTSKVFKIKANKISARPKKG